MYHNLLDNTDFGWRDFYRLAISFIQPRPIAWVSTLDKQGRANLAPYSFFNMVSANPPVVMFAPTMRRDSTHKDSRNNVLATGEFVVNIVTEAVAEAMNFTSGEFPSDHDEFELAGLTKLPSTLVKPFRVCESPIHMECKLHGVYSFGEHPGAGQVIFGQIVALHIDESVLRDGKVDQTLLQTIGRMGGSSYCTTRGMFEIERPEVG